MLSNPKFSPENLSKLNHQTPFLVTSVASAQQNYATLQAYFPGAHIYYAMKSNPDKSILKGLKESGSRFEIASHGELKLLEDIGVNPKDVIYSNPVKPPQHIAKTYEAGVRYFSFDSEQELSKIATAAPQSSVYLRLKVTDQGSVFPLSSKFGAPASDALKLMKHAQVLGLHAAGLTFHVGSQSVDKDTWKAAIEVAGRTIWELQQAGIILEFLDIGGGLPVQHIKPGVNVDELAATISHSLHVHLPYTLKIYIEPGRFLSANTATMVTTIIGRERRGNTEWLFLDVGTFQGLIEYLEMPGWSLPIYTDKDPYTPTQSFTLTGPTCDAQDTLGHGIVLPKDLAVGDRLYIGNTGAYTLTYAAAAFNGFEPPKVYYTED